MPQKKKTKKTKRTPRKKPPKAAKKRAVKKKTAQKAEEKAPTSNVRRSRARLYADAREGDIDAIEALLSSGVNAWSLFFHGISRAALALVRRLLETESIKVAQPAEDLPAVRLKKQTLKKSDVWLWVLHDLAKAKDTALVDYFVEHSSGEFAKALLSEACLKGNLELVAHLVEVHGLDIRSRIRHGDRPVIAALNGDQPEILRFLAGKGLDLTKRDIGQYENNYKGNFTPLEWAKKHRKRKALAFLMNIDSSS